MAPVFIDITLIAFQFAIIYQRAIGNPITTPRKASAHCKSTKLLDDSMLFDEDINSEFIVRPDSPGTSMNMAESNWLFLNIWNGNSEIPDAFLEKKWIVSLLIV